METRELVPQPPHGNCCLQIEQLITITDGRLTVRKGYGRPGFPNDSGLDAPLYPSPSGSSFAVGTYRTRGGETQQGLGVISAATGQLSPFPIPSTLQRGGWTVCRFGALGEPGNGVVWLSASVVLAWECDGTSVTHVRTLFLNVTTRQWSVGPVSTSSYGGACALSSGRWLLTYTNPESIYVGDSLNMQVSPIRATPGITNVACSPDGASVYIVAGGKLYAAPSESINSSAWSYQ